MATNITKISKSIGGLLRNTKNLQLLIGNTFAGNRLSIEYDICCGLGRKVVYFSKGGGTPTTISKFPVTFNGTQYFNKTDLAEALTIFFGVGYVVYVPNAGNAVIIGAQYKKGSDGTLEDIPDFVTIS